MEEMKTVEEMLPQTVKNNGFTKGFVAGFGTGIAAIGLIKAVRSGYGALKEFAEFKKAEHDVAKMCQDDPAVKELTK